MEEGLSINFGTALSSEKVNQIRLQIQKLQLSAAKATLPLSENIENNPVTSFLELSESLENIEGNSDSVVEDLLKINNLEAKIADGYRRHIPARVPVATLDFCAERIRRLKQREALRIRQLEDELKSAPEELKSKILVELKGMRLADRQRQLRESVLRVAQRQYQLLDGERGTLRRGRKQTLKDLRLNEKRARIDRNRRERPLSSDRMGQVMVAMREAVAQQKAVQQRRNKLVRAVQQHHQAFEREEQRRQERLSKERLKALRADNEEEYLRLLDREKNVRITQLLSQTDDFLHTLRDRIVTQQNDPTHLALGTDETEMAVVENEPAKDAASEYYHTAHRRKEAVAQQSSLLTGGQLKDYQLRGVEWMLSLYNNRLNGILADEMGLGKTIQTIGLLAHLMEHKKNTGPFLVIVPLSTMTNWTIEFERWAPSIQRVEYRGGPAERKSLAAAVKAGRFHVLLTTYEYIIKDKSVLGKVAWQYMIIDEGHRMKNTQSKLAVVLGQHYTARFRLILTGTPLQNNLPELWSLLNFVLPMIFHSTATFEEWFSGGLGERVELNEEETLLIIRRLHKVLSPFLLRRLKKDVEAELPDKVEHVVKCPMSALQQRLYDIVRRQGQGSGAAAGGLRRLNNTIMQLRKICNHPFVFEEVERQINPRQETNDLLFRCAGKFELLRRVLPKLSATGHRVLIFFQMTQVMSIMEDLLHLLGFRYLRLDGSTKAEERSALLEQFNAPDSPFFVFLLSTRAGGLGLNLQTADTVIIFDSDWNPHQDLQAQDRAHRIGQTREVRILRLVTLDSVEEYILERAQFKLSLDGKVIQAGRYDQKSTNEEREAMLRSIFEREQERHDVDGVYTDDELNELLARNDSEIAIFKELDSRRTDSRPPLIQESELPKVYLAEVADEPEQESVSSDIRSARLKRDISYNEDALLGDLDDELGNRKRKSKQESPATASPTKLRLRVGSSTHRALIEKMIEAVENCIEEETMRSRSELFQDLPSPADYPDYYQIIKKPMALDTIKSKINIYRSAEEALKDFDLMFDNAMTYNVEGSLIYEDAEIMKNLVHELHEMNDNQ